MAIKFKHNGQEWQTDTPEEAIRLRRELDRANEEAIICGDEASVVGLIWTPDTFIDLLKNCGPLQKQFLRLLDENESLASADIVRTLKLQSEEAFAGVLSGLSKQLKKAELQPWDLYSVTVRWNSEGKTRTFRLSPGFRWAAEELGWPEKWI